MQKELVATKHGGMVPQGRGSQSPGDNLSVMSENCTSSGSEATWCKVTLLIPTLNEIDGMKVIMPQINRDWVHQILILDGGSTDGTIEWARENGYEVYVQKEAGIRQGYMEVLPSNRGRRRPDIQSRREQYPASDSRAGGQDERRL